MLELFSLELENQTTVLNENLLTLETFIKHSKSSNLAGIASTLESLMRAVHSIKGAAKIVRIESAVRLAHIMEDCFVGATNQTLTFQEDHIDSLFQGIDILQRIGQLKELELETWLTENQSSLSEVMSKIGKILGRRKDDSEDPPIIAEEEPVKLSLDDIFPDGDSREDGEKQTLDRETDYEDISSLIPPLSEVSQILNSSISNFNVSESLARSLSPMTKIVLSE